MYPPPVEYCSDENNKAEEVEANGEEEEREQARCGCVPPYFARSEYQYFLIYNFNLSSNFLCARSPDRAEAPGEVSLKKSNFNISCILNLPQ